MVNVVFNRFGGGENLERKDWIYSDGLDKIPQEVVTGIKKYFVVHLPRYEIVKVRKKSYHEDDAHLYMVSAVKRDGTFAVWTSWNNLTKTLNHGHYDLPDLEACDRIMDEFLEDGLLMVQPPV